jgi:hypothetical protein
MDIRSLFATISKFYVLKKKKKKKIKEILLLQHKSSEGFTTFYPLKKVTLYPTKLKITQRRNSNLKVLVLVIF